MESTNLIQLVYLSDRSPTLRDESILDGIVLPSMRFNESADITGCLWFGRGHFLQVLEGPQEAVRALYARIEKDKRHRNVRLLLLGPIAERSFSRFAMKYIREREMSQMEGVVAQFATALPSVSSGPSADSRGSGTALKQSLRTIIVAVKRLAFWRARKG